MYEVIIAPKALAKMKGLKKILQTAVDEAIKDLKEDPFCGKPLTRELTRQYTYRIGTYRLLYKIDKSNKKVYILKAGHRSTIYSKN